MAEQPDPVLQNGESEIEGHCPVIQPSSSRTLEQDRSSEQSPSPKSGTLGSIPHGTDGDRPPKTEDPTTDLEDYDWASLEEKFHTKMDECGRAEQKLYDEFSNCIRVFEAWASVTTSYDNDRYHKRLKTRIAYVNGAEDRLEQKRQHYLNVVKAFESALALLGST